LTALWFWEAGSYSILVDDCSFSPFPFNVTFFSCRPPCFLPLNPPFVGEFWFFYPCRRVLFRDSPPLVSFPIFFFPLFDKSRSCFFLFGCHPQCFPPPLAWFFCVRLDASSLPSDTLFSTRLPFPVFVLSWFPAFPWQFSQSLSPRLVFPSDWRLFFTSGAVLSPLSTADGYLSPCFGDQPVVAFFIFEISALLQHPLVDWVACFCPVHFLLSFWTCFVPSLRLNEE